MCNRVGRGNEVFELNWVYEWLSGFPGKEIGVSVVTLVGYALLRLAWRWILIGWAFLNSRSRALNAVRRHRTRAGIREGRGLWQSEPICPPANYEGDFRTRVLVVANNKGGVGKTTLSANLGAYWAREWKKKVLLVDLDFQGTMSAMALRQLESWTPKGQDLLATRAVSGDLQPGLFVGIVKEVPQEPRLKIVPAYYDLAQAENRLIVEWLLQAAPRRSKSIRRFVIDLLTGKAFQLADIRYNLAELLQNKAVRDEFDVVILDCPPRLTTSGIQALCSGSHLLVPTLLDRLCAEAVVTFCEEVERLRFKGVCPNLQYVGIVGMKVSPNVNLIAERDAKKMIGDALTLRGSPTGLLPEAVFIRQSAAFLNNSEEGIAYLAMGDGKRQKDLKDVIGSLADYVAGQIGLPEPQAHLHTKSSGAKAA